MSSILSLTDHLISFSLNSSLFLLNVFPDNFFFQEWERTEIDFLSVIYSFGKWHLNWLKMSLLTIEIHWGSCQCTLIEKLIIYKQKWVSCSKYCVCCRFKDYRGVVTQQSVTWQSSQQSLRWIVGGKNNCDTCRKHSQGTLSLETARGHTMLISHHEIR